MKKQKTPNDTKMTMQLVKIINIDLPEGLSKPEKVRAKLLEIDNNFIMTPWEHSEIAIHGQVTIKVGRGESLKEFMIRTEGHAYKVYKL